MLTIAFEPREPVFLAQCKAGRHVEIIEEFVVLPDEAENVSVPALTRFQSNEVERAESC